MPTGKLKTFVHPSQERYFNDIKLFPDLNDNRYGIIQDSAGKEVYFTEDAVDKSFAFDELTTGQNLDYTLDNTPYLRAATVRPADAPQPTI